MIQSTSNQKGFTLLEVMISVSILAFLAIATTQAIQNAVKSKAKVQTRVDRVSEVRDALRIIERDINMAFHYRDINIQLYNNSIDARQKQSKTKKKDGDNKLPPPGFKAEGGVGSGSEDTLQKKKEVILTHFKGDEDAVHFTTLNNTRTTVDSKESDQAEVSYYIEQCTNRVNKTHRSDCLWRRVSPIIDDDVTRGGTAIPLLENVTEFTLRYLGPGREEEWAKRWHSDSQGDALSQNKFPYAVEVTIETQDKTREKAPTTRMTMVASLRFPNNPQQQEGANANSGLGQTAQPTSPAQ